MAHNSAGWAEGLAKKDDFSPGGRKITRKYDDNSPAVCVKIPRYRKPRFGRNQ